VGALYESVDLDRVKRRYRELYRNYISFLEENEIEHNLVPPKAAGEQGVES
jgi:hypothetical protein